MLQSVIKYPSLLRSICCGGRLFDIEIETNETTWWIGWMNDLIGLLHSCGGTSACSVIMRRFFDLAAVSQFGACRGRRSCDFHHVALSLTFCIAFLPFNRDRQTSSSLTLTTARRSSISIVAPWLLGLTLSSRPPWTTAGPPLSKEMATDPIKTWESSGGLSRGHRL